LPIFNESNPVTSSIGRDFSAFLLTIQSKKYCPKESDLIP